MDYIVEQGCACGRVVVATVSVRGGGALYGLGDYGPCGAVFEDPADVEIVDTVAITDDGAQVETPCGYCACGADLGRALADDAAHQAGA
jgi:hypothetical protein